VNGDVNAGPPGKKITIHFGTGLFVDTAHYNKLRSALLGDIPGPVDILIGGNKIIEYTSGERVVYYDKADSSDADKMINSLLRARTLGYGSLPRLELQPDVSKKRSFDLYIPSYGAQVGILGTVPDTIRDTYIGWRKAPFVNKKVWGNSPLTQKYHISLSLSAKPQKGDSTVQFRYSKNADNCDTSGNFTVRVGSSQTITICDLRMTIRLSGIYQRTEEISSDLTDLQATFDAIVQKIRP
jgi:hypothetical protein